MLPDLPLHGDSEDRPRHPYTPDWFADVIAGFCREVGGPRPLLAGHDIGAELALQTVATGRLHPARLALLPNRLHRRDEFAGKRAAWRVVCRAAALPVFDRTLARGATFVFRPSIGERLSAQHNPAARDLVRHAFADVAGNGNRARSWAKFARRWPAEAQRELLDAYPRIDGPVLLLWADQDPVHPLIGAYQVLDLLPDYVNSARCAGTGLPDGLRRSGRGGAGADLVLRVTAVARAGLAMQRSAEPRRGGFAAERSSGG